MPASETPSSTRMSPSALASSLALTISRLARRVRQESMSTGQDITASQLAALASIARLGPVTLGELASVEQVQPPTMTRIVARLEAADFVGRSEDPRDRRIVLVEITDAGRAFLLKSRTRRDMFLARRVAELDDEERELLARALPLLERLQDDCS